MIIGGAEDKKGECSILKEVANLALNNNGKLLALTTATQKPQETGREYRNAFERLGVKDIDILNIDTRDDANQQYNYDKILNSGCIFFTGGDQLRITGILGGTLVYRALQKVYENGVAIAGTSAGASAMSSTMIVEGDSSDSARRCTLKMAPGLGLLEEVIIDQHFAQRGRIGRLLCSVAENPYMLGVGIDEDTAVRVYPDGHFETIGTNAVTVLDGTAVKSSNVSEMKPDEILSISGIILHLIPSGYGYNMKTREVLRIN